MAVYKVIYERDADDCVKLDLDIPIIKTFEAYGGSDTANFWVMNNKDNTRLGTVSNVHFIGGVGTGQFILIQN